MGLLRLIHASRLAPLEELLAELKSGTPGSVANIGASRAGLSASAQARPATPLATTPASTATEARHESPAPHALGTISAPTEVAAPKGKGTAPRVHGISLEQVAEIKAAIQAQQKFLGELVEHGSTWELEGPELRIYFSPDKHAFAEMIEGRESLEKIRTISSKVLGRAVRVCARLESVAAAAAASGPQELRAQFERDPLVRSMLQRFGGKISEVRPRQEEK
jgi:hypothetical protein